MWATAHFFSFGADYPVSSNPVVNDIVLAHKNSGYTANTSILEGGV